MEESKFVLCVLRTQIGKTFTAIQQIQSQIDNDSVAGRSLHIITTMNSLLNNEQFSSRLNHIENTYGKNSICIFASKYTGKYKHVKNREELQGICMDVQTCPRVIVMCSNTVRFEDGVQFIKVLHQEHLLHEENARIVRLFCYYDELHEYITETLRTQIEEIHAFPIVKSILALTATPYKIWKNEGFWSTLRIIHLNNYSDCNYIGFQDMHFDCIELNEEPYVRPKILDYDTLDLHTLEYIRHVLELHPDILNPYTFSFIPAHKRRSSHIAVRELLFSLNSECVIVMINATEKSLQYINEIGTQTIVLESEYKKTANGFEIEEACDTIARIVKQHKLEHRPIIITGLLSVGMGQTLTHPELGSFTTAIFSHLDLSNDEIYQLFGRITGRMKHWKKYVRTNVYCPETVMHRCKIMEECAHRMLIEYNGERITREEYKKPMKDKCVTDNIRAKKEKKVNKEDVKFERGYQVFNTKDEMDDFAINILGAKRKSNKYDTDASGFKVCSQSVVKVHTTEDIIKQFQTSKAGSNMDKKLKDVLLNEYTYRRYVCYDNATDINSEKYVACWFKRIAV